MIVISGNSGNYLVFSGPEDIKDLMDGLENVIESEDGTYIYGWCSSSVPTPEFTKELNLMKEMVASDLVARARQGEAT